MDEELHNTGEGTGTPATAACEAMQGGEETKQPLSPVQRMKLRVEQIETLSLKIGDLKTFIATMDGVEETEELPSKVARALDHITKTEELATAYLTR